MTTATRWADNNIVQAWLVLVLAVIFASALAGIQITLGPVIENNKVEETRQKVPELVLAKDAVDRQLQVEPQIVTVDKAGKRVSYSVFKAMQNNAPVGWVVKTAGQGYADRIELLVGLNPSADRINGIFVLEQKETPGLGAKVVTDKWRSQFVGKDASQPLTVVKGGRAKGNQIDAVTGATISSRSVTAIVNSAISDVRGKLSGGA